MDHLDSPPHIHGWHRNNHRSRDRRRTRRELRACPAVTRRHLDFFVALYEDTVWVQDVDIERELSSDTGRNDNSPEGEQQAIPNELEQTKWPYITTTTGKVIVDVSPSTSSSAGAPATTQPQSITSADTDISSQLARDQRQTAHDEIMAIMTRRLDIKTREIGTKNSTPLTITDTTTPTSTSRTTTQPAPEPTGESGQTEYRPELMSLLDWFMKSKEDIGNTNVPGGSRGGG